MGMTFGRLELLSGIYSAEPEGERFCWLRLEKVVSAAKGSKMKGN